MPIVDGIIVNGTSDKTINYCGEVVISENQITIKEQLVDKQDSAEMHEEQNGSGDANEI